MGQCLSGNQRPPAPRPTHDIPPQIYFLPTGQPVYQDRNGQQFCYDRNGRPFYIQQQVQQQQPVIIQQQPPQPQPVPPSPRDPQPRPQPIQPQPRPPYAPPEPSDNTYPPPPIVDTYVPPSPVPSNQSVNTKKIVLGIDFGTTESGYAYCIKSSEGQIIEVFNIETNTIWPNEAGRFKTNTVLRYNESGEVTKWGFPALVKHGERRTKDGQRPVELFKLHLADIPEDNKPFLPQGMSFRKAIADYLFKLGENIKTALQRRFPQIQFYEDILIVMTVPAEFDDTKIAIMRTAAYEARLIDKENSPNLMFTTEPEAAAIYCLHYLKEYNLQDNRPFMVVDCGGGTVDLTTRTLLPGKKLSEITIRTGGYCGSSYVDRNFLLWLNKCLGNNVVRSLLERHYGEVQFLVQEFFIKQVKLEFTGKRSEFEDKILDLEELCKSVKQYVSSEKRSELEMNHWTLRLDFDAVKEMFDGVIEGILSLIREQIRLSDQESQAIFLVGGFSESQYLYDRIVETFRSRIPLIAVGHQPTTAVMRGAVLYGDNMSTVTRRVLKWTYGVGCLRKYDERIHDRSRRIDGDRVKCFDRLAKRGEAVSVNEEFKGSYQVTQANQTRVAFPVYISANDNEQYVDGLKKMGEVVIDIPRGEQKRKIEFSLTFGQMEIQAAARVPKTGQTCRATFWFDTY